MRSLFSHNPQILVVGDLMIDHYVFGGVERISPEAPVPILRVSEENNRLGGACNVANNLIALGAKVALCGAVGSDNDGETLRQMLKNGGIETDLVESVRDFATIKKTRLIAQHQQVLRVDRERANLAANPFWDEDKIAAKITAAIAGFDCVILSDYAKGVLSESFCQKIIAAANAAKLPILCDPKGENYAKYAHATLITPNKKEAQAATKIPLDSPESLRAACAKLKADCALDYAIITLSEDGMAVFGESLSVIPTLAKEVFDVTGAGDTAIAALGFGLSSGMGILDCARFANAAAAVVVGKVGSAVATLDEIFSLANEFEEEFGGEFGGLGGEIEKILALKHRGEKIVFTNGCFDLLHAGHIAYLKAAKKLGDILVVGLNSDESVRILKGKERPINAQSDRAAILGALECVDFVVIFDEETPLNLIKKIQPDILVKGGDYVPQNIVGSEVVKDVRVLDFIPNKSTTNLIKKIKGENNE